MNRVSLLFVIWLVYLEPTQQENSEHLFVVGVNSNATTTRHESVPKECKELGLCEDSIRYPEELAEKLIKELKEAKIRVDTVDSDEPNIPQFEPRLGFDDLTNPCASQSKTIAPLMIRGLVDGKWYYSLNSKVNPIQIYNVQVCAATNSSGSMGCGNQLILSDEYKSQCIQKSMTRKVIVIKDGKAHTTLANIPCCCTCVAVNKEMI